MTVLIHNNDDVDIENSIEEVKVVTFTRESDSFVLDAMNQMKEKFDENERNVNSIKRKYLCFRNELMITSGMICVIDDLMHEFDMMELPGEVPIMMSVLRGRIADFVERKIVTDNSLKLDEEEEYGDSIRVEARVEIVPQ